MREGVPSLFRLRSLRQEAVPPLGPPKERLHPPLRLFKGGDAEQRFGEAVQLHTRLRAGFRGGVALDLGERMEDAALVARMGPCLSERLRKAVAPVRDDHLGGGNALHQG